MRLGGQTLPEMISETRGYVELFLEDLEHEETIIEQPQEILMHILTTLEFAEITFTSNETTP
jgi:hypothetical protein